MPELRGEDERAHFTSEERDALSKEIVALIKARLTDGQGNHPACMQCVATVAALTLAEVFEEVKATEHVGEALGVAKLAITTSRYLDSAKQVLADRALDMSMTKPGGLAGLLAVVAGGEHG